MEIKIGQQFQLIPYGDRMGFFPVRKIMDMIGFLKGINTDIPRDKDRI